MKLKIMDLFARCSTREIANTAIRGIKTALKRKGWMVLEYPTFGDLRPHLLAIGLTGGSYVFNVKLTGGTVHFSDLGQMKEYERELNKHCGTPIIPVFVTNQVSPGPIKEFSDALGVTILQIEDWPEFAEGLSLCN